VAVRGAGPPHFPHPRVRPHLIGRGRGGVGAGGVVLH
jgi:hypothetical protein